jgi:hypothetical protein
MKLAANGEVAVPLLEWMEQETEDRLFGGLGEERRGELLAALKAAQNVG